MPPALAQDARVRLASVNALLALYSAPDNLASLADFTQRFQQRFSELFYDVDEAVAVKGVSLAWQWGCASSPAEQLRMPMTRCCRCPLASDAPEPRTLPGRSWPQMGPRPCASAPQVELNTLLVKQKQAQPSQFAQASGGPPAPLL